MISKGRRDNFNLNRTQDTKPWNAENLKVRHQFNMIFGQSFKSNGRINPGFVNKEMVEGADKQDYLKLYSIYSNCRVKSGTMNPNFIQA